jgi:hypothetical protein
VQPFRDDDDVLRARAGELEEELSGLRERLTRLRGPAQLRVEQLEKAVEAERRMLEVTRRQPVALMMWVNQDMLLLAIALFCFVLLRLC